MSDETTFCQYAGKICRIVTYMAGMAILRPIVKAYLAIGEKLKAEVEHE